MNKCCFGIVSQQRFCCLQRYRKGAWSIPIHSNSAFAGVNRKKGKAKNLRTLGREIWRGKLKKVENLEMSTLGRGIWREN